MSWLRDVFPWRRVESGGKVFTAEQLAQLIEKLANLEARVDHWRDKAITVRLENAELRDQQYILGQLVEALRREKAELEAELSDAYAHIEEQHADRVVHDDDVLRAKDRLQHSCLQEGSVVYPPDGVLRKVLKAGKKCPECGYTFCKGDAYHACGKVAGMFLTDGVYWFNGVYWFKGSKTGGQ